MVTLLVERPELAAAVTTSPARHRPRRRAAAPADRRRVPAALPRGARRPADDVLLETLSLAFAGALLQTGMGLITYAELGDRLDAVVATIMKGQP